MPISLEVFLRAENLPPRDAWQQAIDAEEIELQLDNCDTKSHEGSWPCTLNGIDCGFEYIFAESEPSEFDDRPTKAPNRRKWASLFGAASSLEAAEPQEIDKIHRQIGDRDHIAVFKWRSSLDDGRAASFAAAVLAKVADGFLFDPQSGELTAGKDAVDLVKAQDRSERDLKSG